MIVAHVIVALGSVLEELDVLGIFTDGLVEVVNGLSELALHVVTLAETVVTGRVVLLLML